MTDGRLVFVHCLLELSGVFEDIPELKVCRWDVGVEADGFLEVFLRRGELIEELLGDCQIQIRPRGRMTGFKVQADRLLVIQDGRRVLVEVVVAKAEIVVCVGHARRQVNGLLKMLDGLVVVMHCVLDSSEPVRIKCIVRMLPGQCLQGG